MALWRRPAGAWLVVVNIWPLEREISWRTEDKPQAGRLIPFGATRDTHAVSKSGQLTVGNARPWEVFVWKVESSAAE